MVTQMNVARITLALAMMVLAYTFSAPSQAQEPVNPTAQSVQEEQLLQELQDGGAVSGRVSIPDKRSAMLIKPEGKEWSGTHNNTVYWLSALAIVGMVVLLGIFYMVRGRIRLEHGWAGRTIQRFNSFERFAHWLTATCFVLLALTGLNLVFGRYILIPLFGADTFATVTQLGKFVHNYVAWPFMLGIVIMFLVWVRDNIPGKIDVDWIKQGGGMFKKGVHPPAKRFNAGQKIIFWSVIIGGTALSVTGVFLMFPELVGDANNWQLSQVIHALVAAVMTAVILAHIYIGSLGMEGAFDAMGKGEVDLNWAREHHALWVAEKDKTAEATPARGHVAPAE